jgi:hypothetical protein
LNRSPEGGSLDLQATRSSSIAWQLAGAALVAAAFAAVIVFLPPEGRVMVPLHTAVDTLLGGASFLLPLALLFVGVVLLVRRRRPDVVLPTRRLVGVGVLAIAVFPSERLLGGSTGLIGDWLEGLLIDLLGGPATVVLLLLLVGVGAALTFGVRFTRHPDAAR